MSIAEPGETVAPVSVIRPFEERDAKELQILIGMSVFEQLPVANQKGEQRSLTLTLVRRELIVGNRLRSVLAPLGARRMDSALECAGAVYELVAAHGYGGHAYTGVPRASTSIRICWRACSLPR